MLLDAAKDSNYNKIKQLIEEGTDVHAREEALLLAAENGLNSLFPA